MVYNLGWNYWVCSPLTLINCYQSDRCEMESACWFQKYKLFFFVLRICLKLFSLQGLALMRQVVYHLSHISSSFCSILQKGSHFLFRQPGLWSYFTLSSIAEMAVLHHHTQLRWGLTNFLAQLVYNCNPPDLGLPSSWNYRHAPPTPSSSSRFCRGEYWGWTWSCTCEAHHSATWATP
jgi:hypothetical protein